MRCGTGVSAGESASGEILNEEFLKPLRLTADAFALSRNDRSTACRLDGGVG
jgi:plasmid maintenance system antidote protein VapI